MAGKTTPKNIFGQEKKIAALDERLAKFRINRDGIGVDWKNVSALTFRCALALGLSEGYQVTFAPAAGGLGCMVKLWNGGQDVKEYVMNSEQMNQLLESLIDALASGSEDVRLVYAGGAE